MTRDEAKKLGLTTYTAVRPCKRAGHVVRFVTNKNCVECATERARQEKLRDPEGVSRRFAEHHQKNRERRLKQQRLWRSQNMDHYNRMQRGRSRRVKQATPHWLTPEQHQQMRRIYYTCPEGYEVDHMVPINGRTVCGLHVPWNLQHLLAEENRQKGNKLLVIASV